jgi:hypothetical protein
MKQGCQMVYFQTKNTNLGKIWRALEWKMLLHFMTIWNIFWSFWNNLWPFGIVCGHLVYFSRFGRVWTKRIWQPWDEAALQSSFHKIRSCRWFQLVTVPT